MTAGKDRHYFSKIKFMAIDYVLLRPRRKENLKQDFNIVLRKVVNSKTHVKLGLYDPQNGKIEEWCFKEDADHFKQARKSELGQ